MTFLTTKFRLLRIWIAFRGLFLIVGFVTVCLASAAAGGLWWFFNSLPDVHSLNMPTFTVLAKESVERRGKDADSKPHLHRWIPLGNVGRQAVQAIVASEDSGFFQHEGLDYGAIADSVAENLKRKKYAFGASTISQQVVKNVFLTREKTIFRKVKEWVVTYRLEGKFTKKEILEVYLNIIEVGPGLYGIDQAARHYFGKSPSELNAAEGAFIAVLLPSPVKYAKRYLTKQALTPDAWKRVRRVLRDLAGMSVITEEELQRYWNYPFFGYASADGAHSTPSDDLGDSDAPADQAEESESERSPTPATPDTGREGISPADLGLEPETTGDT